MWPVEHKPFRHSTMRSGSSSSSSRFKIRPKQVNASTCDFDRVLSPVWRQHRDTLTRFEESYMSTQRTSIGLINWSTHISNSNSDAPSAQQYCTSRHRAITGENHESSIARRNRTLSHHECLRANAGSSRTIPPWKGVSRPQRMRASCRPSLSLDGQERLKVCTTI